MKFERKLNSRTTFQGRITGALLLILMTQGTMPAWAGGKAINVQGKLTDRAGNPLAGGQVVTFRLYKNPAGPASTCDANDPNCVWSESQGVTPQNGLFNVTLGNAAPLDAVPFNIPYYLGMQVAGDANELAPRQLLGSSAYSLGSLGDFNVTGSVFISSNVAVSGNITAGSVSAASATLNMGTIQNLIGSASGTGACAGCVGETLRSYTTGTNYTTNCAYQNMVSILLSPGDWDVTGLTDMYPNDALYSAPGPGQWPTVMSILSQSSGNPADLAYADNFVSMYYAAIYGAGHAEGNADLVIPSWAVTVSQPTRIYLKERICGYNSGTPIISARISARRTH